MKRNQLLIWGAALLAFALAVPAAPVGQATASTDFFDGFEHGLQLWGVAATAGEYSLTVQSGENGCNDLLGNHYAQMQFTPDGVGGAVWAVSSFEGSGLDMVNVKWNAADKSDCAECQPVVYVGQTNPTDTSLFDVDGAPLSKEWQPYQYPQGPEPILLVPNQGTIYVAIGVQANNGNFAKVTRTSGLDCVTISINPVVGDPATNPAGSRK